MKILEVKQVGVKFNNPMWEIIIEEGNKKYILKEYLNWSRPTLRGIKDEFSRFPFLFKEIDI